MRASAAFLFVLFVLSHVANGQARVPASREFQITKITKNLVPTPDYGIGQYRATANERWLEVEVEFNAAPEWTDELTLKRGSSKSQYPNSKQNPKIPNDQDEACSTDDF